jgi:hypothetical protein
MNEVKQHQKEGSMWTVLKGRVYNISPYMRFHPGGMEMILICSSFMSSVTKFSFIKHVVCGELVAHCLGLNLYAHCACTHTHKFHINSTLIRGTLLLLKVSYSYSEPINDLGSLI